MSVSIWITKWCDVPDRGLMRGTFIERSGKNVIKATLEGGEFPYYFYNDEWFADTPEGRAAALKESYRRCTAYASRMYTNVDLVLSNHDEACARFTGTK